MNQTDTLRILGLERWPFSLVPVDDGSELIWADRAELLAKIRRMLRGLQRHTAPTLHLLWADFGAGKTHTLRYIAQESNADRVHGIVPIYSALPKGCRTFLDVYRAIVRAIGAPTLGEAFRVATRKPALDSMRQAWPDLWAALKVISIGNETQSTIASNWILGTPGMGRQELNSISLHGRIGSTESAVLALSGIVRVLSIAHEKRVLLMVDEFQRIETLRQGDRDEINAGLHSFYNASQVGVSIMLSFSFGVEGHIQHFLNQELLSRADPLRFSLPHFDVAAGVLFLGDIIRASSTNYQEVFVGPEGLELVVRRVAAEAPVTPRRLVKLMGYVATEAISDIEDGVIDKVATDYVSSILETLPSEVLKEEEE